jgi:amino acid permease
LTGKFGNYNGVFGKLKENHKVKEITIEKMVYNDKINVRQGWYLIFVGILGMLILCVSFIVSPNISGIFVVIFFSLIFLLHIYAGCRVIKDNRLTKRVKKLILRSSFVILIFVVLLYPIYKINDKTDTIYISNAKENERFILGINNDNYYIHIKEKDIRVKCSRKQYYYIDIFSEDYKKAEYKIEYKFNKLVPGYYTLIDIQKR